jgi:hypothetical protein
MSIDAISDLAVVDRERRLESELKKAAGGTLTYAFVAPSVAVWPARTDACLARSHWRA